MTNIEVFSPADLDEQYWRALQGIARVAMAEALVDADRDEPDSDAQKLIAWNDPVRYYKSHIDPNKEVGRRFNANQEYSHPRVAVAFDDAGNRIGFAYSAHNVSGSPVERRIKTHIPGKRYLWLRDVVVLPEHQRKGVATELTTHLLEDPSTDPRQPVSAYIWPQLAPSLGRILQRHGFEDRGVSRVQPFGTNEEVEQHYLVASTAGSLLERLHS